VNQTLQPLDNTLRFDHRPFCEYLQADNAILAEGGVEVSSRTGKIANQSIDAGAVTEKSK
jgi:hypothetical protein